MKFLVKKHYHVLVREHPYEIRNKRVWAIDDEFVNFKELRQIVNLLVHDGRVCTRQFESTKGVYLEIETINREQDFRYIDVYPETKKRGKRSLKLKNNITARLYRVFKHKYRS